mgnify:CR=1 FL=1
MQLPRALHAHLFVRVTAVTAHSSGSYCRRRWQQQQLHTKLPLLPLGLASSVIRRGYSCDSGSSAVSNCCGGVRGSVAATTAAATGAGAARQIRPSSL